MGSDEPMGHAERDLRRQSLFAKLCGSLPEPKLTVLRGIGIVTLFAIAAFAFAGVSLVIAFSAGEPLFRGGSVTSSRALLDAGWHAATGLLMVLPARNRRLYVLGPILTTEIDVDHLYGAYLPTEVGRPAHDLVFLALLFLVLGSTFGRPGAFLGAAGFLGHVSVDGGGFPFLSPISGSTWSLPLPVEILLAGLAVLLFFTSVRAARELLNRRSIVAVILATVALAGLLAAGGPSLVQLAGV